MNPIDLLLEPLAYDFFVRALVASAGGGRLRIGGYGGGTGTEGVALKRRLLAREGVTLPD